MMLWFSGSDQVRADRCDNEHKGSNWCANFAQLLKPEWAEIASFGLDLRLGELSGAMEQGV
jgi:hypothetical protein